MIKLCNTHVDICERNYHHCQGFAWLVVSYVLQRRAGVYFEGHDLPSSGFTSSGLVLSSVELLLI